MLSKSRTSVRAVDVDDVLSEWRSRAVTVLIYVVLIVALPAFAISAFSMYASKSWAAFVVMSAVYLGMIALALFKKIDFRLRAWVLITLGYVMAAVNLWYFGSAGSARVYLLALPILGFILIGTRTGWVTTAFSALLYAVFCLLDYYAILSPRLLPLDTFDLLNWVTTGFTMMMLLVIIVILLIRMYRFLINTLRKERVLSAELEQTYDATLEGWATALEYRDLETAGHCHRVSAITKRLAEADGTGALDIMDVHRGSLLHDVGKMGIPDSVLLKPGKLTDEEFKQMQQHTTYAYELLSHIPYLKHALDIPYCHHEKWDGSGYPRGLKGTDIPLSARIFSVVDVYDALISDRPYRKAWQEEKAIEYIKERSGKDFDPAVVQAFVKLSEEDTDSLSSSEE